MAMVFYGIVCFLLVVSVPGLCAPPLGRFCPKLESPVTGTEDVPPSVQSELNVQSLEVDLSRLFPENFGSFFSDAAMQVLRGCVCSQTVRLGAVPTWAFSHSAWLRLLFSPFLP